MDGQLKHARGDYLTLSPLLWLPNRTEWKRLARRIAGGESERTGTLLRGRPFREQKTSWVFVCGRLCSASSAASLDWNRVNGGGEGLGFPFPVVTRGAPPLALQPPRGPAPRAAGRCRVLEASAAAEQEVSGEAWAGAGGRGSGMGMG